MKKIISLILVVMLLGTCGLMVGCGKKADSSNNEKITDAKGREIDANIIGKWECKFAGSSYIYTFKKDGKGVYDVAGTKMKLEYYTKKGKVSIRFNPNEEDMKLDYKVKGDTLTVKDSLGKDVKYKKVD